MSLLQPIPTSGKKEADDRMQMFSEEMFQKHKVPLVFFFQNLSDKVQPRAEVSPRQNLCMQLKICMQCKVLRYRKRDTDTIILTPVRSPLNICFPRTEGGTALFGILRYLPS